MSMFEALVKKLSPFYDNISVFCFLFLTVFPAAAGTLWPAVGLNITHL